MSIHLGLFYALRLGNCIHCTLLFTAFDIHFRRVNQDKILMKQSINVKCDEMNIMNIINDNTFNLHNSLLNNDNRYMKVTLKSKLTGVARLLISADYHEF